jgi:hypothetical protein
LPTLPHALHAWILNATRSMAEMYGIMPPVRLDTG